MVADALIEFLKVDKEVIYMMVPHSIHILLLKTEADMLYSGGIDEYSHSFIQKLTIKLHTLQFLCMQANM